MAEESPEEPISTTQVGLERLRQRLDDDTLPWWEQIRGQFKDDPDYDEAMRLGREWRESLRPKDDKDA